MLAGISPGAWGEFFRMTAARPQIRICRSRDGTRIAYATYGKGPPLVWIGHWVGHLDLDWDSPVWRPWLTLLTRRHTLVTYDWRGCGLSDHDDIEFSWVRYQEDLDAVVRAAGLGRFDLVSTSASSSAVAMTFAAGHPRQVNRLILCSSATRGIMARAETAEQVSEAETRLRAVELGWQKERPAYGQFFTAMHIPDATPEQFRAYNDLLRLTTNPRNALAMLRTFYALNVTDVVSQVRCPTLVLHARGDAIISFDEGRAVAAAIPDARFVPLDGRGHIVLDTEPAWRQLVTALDEFLANPPAEPEKIKGLLDELTAREQQVLELVAQGLDNHSTAATLGTSEKTVRNQVSAIRSKLGVLSRVQIVLRAREAGFGQKLGK
jgi:pimeloyl-ACP methyl ester carboxylesterase/DNA-binding CsgD family transcriptional regulator